MNFLRQNKNIAPRAAQSFFALAIAFAILFALSYLAPDIFSSASNSIAYPIWNMRAASDTEGKIPILSRPRWSAYDTFVIGAGSSERMNVGDKIFSEKFILGEITEVYEHTSLVSLYSTAGKEINAQVSGKFPVTLFGNGGGTFVSDIASGTPVADGDGIFFNEMPESVFAVVESVVDTGDGTTKVYSRLPVNIFEINSVEVKK
jgi:hypothetical protein